MSGSLGCSPTGVLPLLWGGEMERALGDSDREVGALTRMESAVDGAVDGATEEGVELWARGGGGPGVFAGEEEGGCPVGVGDGTTEC